MPLEAFAVSLSGGCWAASDSRVHLLGKQQCQDSSYPMRD